MTSKNDPRQTTEGTSRKERRAAERAARKGGPAPTTKAATRSSGPSMFMISVVAVVLGLIAVGALVLASGGVGGDLPAVAAADVPAPAQELRQGRSLGDPDAPVVVEAFEDPQCPACGAFNDRIAPLLIAGPVSDGEVLFTYRDFAFLGPESFDAAAALRVADDLGDKFWDFHDTVFFNQHGENEGAFSLERLADMAVLVGLERDQFLAAMDDPAYLEAVEAESEVGRTLGVNSTPSLFVNGEIMRGVPTWEDLQAKIAEAAAVAAASPAASASAAPPSEAPATAAPPTEAPATEAPATEAPATEVPATEAPATEAPATEVPAAEPAANPSA